MELTIRRTCSGVSGFGGSLPAERVARGGVEGLSDIVQVSEERKCKSITVLIKMRNQGTTAK